jgi:hypothetical protein
LIWRRIDMEEEESGEGRVIWRKKQEQQQEAGEAGGRRRRRRRRESGKRISSIRGDVKTNRTGLIGTAAFTMKHRYPLNPLMHAERSVCSALASSSSFSVQGLATYLPTCLAYLTCLLAYLPYLPTLLAILQLFSQLCCFSLLFLPLFIIIKVCGSRCMYVFSRLRCSLSLGLHVNFLFFSLFFLFFSSSPSQ